MRVVRKRGLKIAVLENGLISTYTAREALMRKLVSLNFEVYVLTSANQYTKKAEETGVHVIDIGSANYNPFKIGNYIIKLKKHFKIIQPDICLTFSIRPAIWGNLIARSMNIPVVTNVTGTGPLFSSHSAAYEVIRRLYPYALKKTRQVFFQNIDDCNQFIARGFVDSEKCCLVPGSGVDPEKFSPIHDEVKHRNHFIFLYIGRMLKDKGVPEFVEAARVIKAKNPDVRFKIIGPVWKQNIRSNRISKRTLKKWVDEGLIEYLGELSDVRPEVADADCIVLPSHREGMSNVLLEASAMEKPCIASNVPGCKEAIDDNITGFLCKPKDSKDLTEKMEMMMKMPPSILRKMGTAARKKVSRQFNKQIVIRYYLDAINEILGERAENITIFTRKEKVSTLQPVSEEAE